MKKIILILVLLIFVVAGIFWLSWNVGPKQPNVNVKKAPLLIGFSLGVYREERWLKDLNLFNEKVNELGAVSIPLMTDQDVDVQISQIRNLISQGVKVIVIVPANSERLAPVVKEANDAGVKIIAYDRMLLNSDVDLYVSFDSFEVGRMQAEGVLNVAPIGNYAYIGGSPTDNNAYLLRNGSMSVLQEKIDSGEIKIVVDDFMDEWDPSLAYEAISSYLASGGKLDGVIAANDGTAFGVINALKEYGLDGKIPVSGQDAELAACLRVVEGTQTLTVYKPIRALAHKAAELAVSMAKGLEIETNSFVNNELKDVPSFLLEPNVVNLETIETTVIKDRFYTREEIFGLGE